MNPEVFYKKIELDFKKRRESNVRYSLRAYSRDLEISVSILSRIRSRDIPISNKVMERLFPKLFISKEDYSLFVEECLKDPNFCSPNRPLTTKEIDLFRRWYFWILWQLNKSGNNLSSIENIAQTLSISTDDVCYVIDWFKKQTLSAEKETHPLELNYHDFLKRISHSCFEERYLCLLQKVANYPFEEVGSYINQKSFSIAINQEMLPYINKRIEEFYTGLISELDHHPSPKADICEFTISLLPLKFN